MARDHGAIARFPTAIARKIVSTVGQRLVDRRQGMPKVASRKLRPTWYLNNGARNHMTGNRKKFQKLDEVISLKVKFGDGSPVEIQGKGTILFDC